MEKESCKVSVRRKGVNLRVLQNFNNKFEILIVIKADFAEKLP